MKWLTFFFPLALAFAPRSAGALADFLKTFAASSLSESQIEILKSEETCAAKIPEKAVESRHVVTFLHRVRNLSRVYQLCVAESETDKSLRLSLGKPDGECQDELLGNFAKIKAGALGEKERNTLQGFLWAESEPAVAELEQKLREFWTAP